MQQQNSKQLDTYTKFHQNNLKRLQDLKQSSLLFKKQYPSIKGSKHFAFLHHNASLTPLETS